MDGPQDVIKAALRKLATELKICTARPLLAAAKGKVPGATAVLAAAALAGQTSTQTFAPAVRSRGKSAAEDVGVIYQAALIDFSGNARSSDGKNKIRTGRRRLLQPRDWHQGHRRQKEQYSQCCVQDACGRATRR